ncbi:MAG: ribonucleoside-diphosphate reductase subunit alpha, partial [Halobacteria archaeon]|nr:ribonucleoside-diphosphate reductase subunit alpha [Halobacteria archaeon]
MSIQKSNLIDVIENCLERATEDYDAVTDEDVEELIEQTERNLYAGAEYGEVIDAAIGVVTSYIEREPAYKKVAAHLYRQKYYREVMDTDTDTDSIYDNHDYRRTFVENIQRAVDEELLDERMLEYDLEQLADAIVPERDELFDYMAMDTLYQRYFLKTPDDERLELPQAFWMRVAMGLALRENESERHERAVEFYEVMSKLLFIPSTPTLFHSGTTHPQLSSCYLTTVKDDLEHIFDSYGSHAQLSKWSGGLGNDWTNVRAAGALIESTGVESTGIVPFLKISNDVTAAINRSGKRRGAACAYLEPWHLDFPDFIDLRRNTGDERRRTHDMNTAAWVPDLFMKRVRNGEEWTLFSPNEVPELHETYGEEFEKIYEKYEEKARNGELRQHEVVDAEELWRKTLTRLFETGHPWITFKDACNVRSPQDHVGTIHSSNLCTEVTLNTSEDEHAVCNLGSVNLSKHVGEDGLERDKIANTVETAMRMLDNVVDLNFYPTDEAERS